MTVRIKGIVEEDFVNYKKISMFISMGTCDWKCCLEQGLDKSICQNSELANTPEVQINIDTLIKMYTSNPITEAIVIGGLEPFTYFYNLYKFISKFREISNDDIVIYTGYYPKEIEEDLEQLLKFDNIIIKYGRFIPNHKPHFDSVLGVNLASNNQYAKELTIDFLRNINDI